MKKVLIVNLLPNLVIAGDKKIFPRKSAVVDYCPSLETYVKAGAISMEDLPELEEDGKKQSGKGKKKETGSNQDDNKQEVTFDPEQAEKDVRKHLTDYSAERLRELVLEAGGEYTNRENAIDFLMEKDLKDPE